MRVHFVSSLSFEIYFWRVTDFSVNCKSLKKMKWCRLYITQLNVPVCWLKSWKLKSITAISSLHYSSLSSFISIRQSFLSAQTRNSAFISMHQCSCNSYSRISSNQLLWHLNRGPKHWLVFQCTPWCSIPQMPAWPQNILRVCSKTSKSSLKESSHSKSPKIPSHQRVWWSLQVCANHVTRALPWHSYFNIHLLQVQPQLSSHDWCLIG